MLSFDRDIVLSSSSFYTTAFADSNYIYAGDASNIYHQYNWSGDSINTINLSAEPVSICLIAPASAIITYSTARVSYIDVATNSKTDVTLNALGNFTSFVGQQSAGDIVNQIVMSTTSTNGKVLKINNNFTLTQLSPTAITSAQASCIIFKPDTSTWLIGTNAGSVFEMNASGTVLKTINVINTPAITAPTITVTGLSYYNGYLAFTIGHGVMYLYNYLTSSLIAMYPCSSRSSATPSTLCLSDCASGTFLLSQPGQPDFNTSALTECYMASGSILFSPYWGDVVNAPMLGQIQPTLAKAFCVHPSNNAAGGLRLYTISDVKITTETTESQDPANVDVGARIIRIRDQGIGNSAVEQDLNVAAGVVPVLCTNDHQYIEYGRESGKADIREFFS